MEKEMSRLRYAALTCAMLLLSPCAHAWWETQIMVLKDPPRITEVEAETAAVGADVVEDTPPFGPDAGGQKAVELSPGKGSLVWKVKVKRSTYVLLRSRASRMRIRRALQPPNG